MENVFRHDERRIRFDRYGILRCCFLVGCITSAELALGQSVYEPVPTSGYNQDAIAESSPALDSTTSVVDGSNYVLYSVAYGEIFGTGTGLPDDGAIAATGRAYQLQRYDANNVLLLMQGETGQIALTTPAPYASISLLGFSTEGAGSAQATIGFGDGSSAVYGIDLPDWFDGSNAVILGFDRTGRDSNTPDFLTDNPRMYAFDLDLACGDFGKIIDTVSIENDSGTPNPRAVIVGVSAEGVDPIQGPADVVVGDTIMLIDATPGGAWSSLDESVATVDADGNVTGVSPGVASIAYSVTFACGSLQQTTDVTVSPSDVIFADGFELP
jgi:hypothetical protein